MEKCQKPGYVCTTADTEKAKAVSLKLYTWLFPKELQKELQNNAKQDGIKHLIFALDRNIRYIPMGALFDGQNYLIEKYAISTVVSAGFSEDMPFPDNSQNISVLAMGASKFPSGEKSLRYVPVELNAIVNTGNQDRLGVYPGIKFLNTDFSKRNLKNNLYGRRILHIATHGVFSLDSAANTYLLFSNKEKLPIPEIETINDLNNLDLVVLSACQTGLGGRENEEGIEISSLSSAFLRMGAKSVMSSLWNVDDISTSLLMQGFYKNLAQNSRQTRISRAEALRRVQRQFLEGDITGETAKQMRGIIKVAESELPATPATSATPDFKHPYYWSSFVLTGSGF